jgi:ABC-type antimicrobial peptide transport system permease subunit
MRFFSSLGSRVTGYEGCDIAANYIYSKFLEYGLENVHFQNFSVTIPIDCGAKITVLSPIKKVIKAYPLWPNVVATSPINASGNLLYCGNLELKELDGKDISGNFILADFNSYDNWINVAKFGAKGVIFIEPVMTTVGEAKSKILDIPLNFPRLWISKEDGDFLLRLLSSGENVFVHVESNMVWREVQAKNVIGMINGTVYGYNVDPNGTIVYKKLTASQINTPQEATIPHYEAISITAHYDSFSYVPSLAPGADDSAGISALLEFANYFSKNRPRRTIIFIAFSGFWQGLFGSRTYVDENFGVKIEGSTLNWDLTRIHFNLDYSSDSDALALMYTGDYYGAWSTRWTDCPLARASPVASKAKEYYKEITRQLGKEYRFYDAVVNFWHEYSPVPYMLDAEPFALAGSTALAFRTAFTWRSYWNTPFDTIDRVKWENLKPQIELSLCLLVPFANEDNIQRAFPLYRSEAPFSFGTLLIQVTEYDYKTGWYKPVPNALVHIKLMSQEEVRAPGGLGTAASSPYLQDLIVKTDERGFVRIAGLARCTSTFEPIIWVYQYSAYVIDENGNIVYGTDRGVYGGSKFPLTGSLDIEPARRVIPVFRCGSLVLFDLMDPASFARPWRIELFTLPGYTMPIFFGGDFSLEKPIAILFLKPGEAYVVKATDNYYNLVYLLTNASRENPEGTGFILNAGETEYIYGPYKSCWDIHTLNDFRYQTLIKYGVGDIEAYKSYENGKIFFEKAGEALRSRAYSEFYTYSLTTLQIMTKVHSTLKDMVYGGLLTISSIFALTIPAAFLLERLMLSWQGLKRLAAIMAFFAAFVLLLFLFHPAFAIAYNTPLALLGTGVTVLLIPVLWISINSAIKLFATLRRRLLGAHAVEREIVGYISSAMSLGIENMRKRKFRTFLMFVTLTLIVFSSVVFTSFSSLIALKEAKERGSTPYTGILLRRAKIELANPLTWELYQYVRSLFSDCIVAPMSWYYPQRQTLTIFYGNKSYTITLKAALMALTPEDEDLFDFGETLTFGSMWFLENDEYAVIISDRIAEELGVRVGEKINVLGLDLLVRGIFRSDLLEQIVDLDQKPRLPLDTLAPQEEQMVLEKRIPAWAVIIVPFSLGRKLNFPIYAISIKVPGDLGRIYERARPLALNTNLDIYVGAEGEIIASRKTVAVNLTGWNFMIIPLIIASLVVLTTVLGAIYERAREMTIYSALGLSPSAVGAMFAIEVFTYIPISSAIGYVMGIACNRFLYNVGFYPEGFFINFSSTYTVLSIGITTLACVIALLYPIYKASRVVTPSLERAWRIPTRPLGDEWAVPMPVRINEFKEARALLRYLYDFLVNYPRERGGAFMLESLDLREIETEQRASLNMSVRLPPYDAGIAQLVEIRFFWSEELKRYLCEIYAKRTSGLVSKWESSNRRFFDEIRKQLLLWKVLRPKDKERYYAMLKQSI